MSLQTVVFICTGNTCRSPLAMALARRAWPQAASFASAGLRAVGGEPASSGALAVADELGLDLQEHRARQLTDDLALAADWLIGMTRAHARQLQERYGAPGAPRIGLLSLPGVDLSGRPLPAADEVADPFGGRRDAYRAAADQLARLLRAWERTFSGMTRGEA